MVSWSTPCFFSQGNPTRFLEDESARGKDVDRPHVRACFGVNVGARARRRLLGVLDEECLGTKESGRRVRITSINRPAATTSTIKTANKVLSTMEPPGLFVNCSPSTMVGGLLPDADGLAFAAAAALVGDGARTAKSGSAARLTVTLPAVKTAA